MTTAPETTGPVQRALYAVLNGDGALGDLIAGIYDYLPEDVPYPFVQLGEATEVPSNAHDRFGRETVVTLHGWDQYRGYSRIQQVGARIVALLDHQPLTIEGLDHVVTRFEFSQTLTDPEPPGDIRHLVQRFRVVTEQPPTP
ncbi:hypothetical protein CG717_16190 [Streptomyces sp. CB02613]|uniref:DUF3168 domain-containing protein n=1 Tax=Streptomyces sp. CB02613 TaxID=2020328 RepID=UPI000C276913|nr:DUF3168 domain-containing protein [Streptomyces sp. CB02613]PJN31306.1 hypothetical protein CG717_16190 [Streptomyces sp. CB02613]